MTPVDLKSLNKLKDSNSSSNDHHQQQQTEFKRPSSFLIAVAFTCALTAFHFGYAISSINVPSAIFLDCKVDDANKKTFFGLQGCFHLSKAAWGLVGMGLPLGGWIGGSLAPSLVSKLGGIKAAILFLNIPLCVAYLFMSLATNLPMLVIGRILIGFASGASGMLVPLYLSSVSPLAFRGLFTNFFQLVLCSAAFIAEIISFSADLGKHLWLWRFSFAVGLLVIALQTVLNRICGVFPESPIDLDLKDQTEAGMLRFRLGILDDSVEKHPDNINNSNSESIPEISTTTATSDSTTASDSILRLITFRIPEARKSLLIGILLHAGQQISGVNAVFFYSSLINKGSQSTPVLLTLINLIMTFVAIWLLDRAGRRPVALFSVAGASTSLIALAFSFSFFPATSPIFLIGFVAFFAVGLGPIPWMLLPELFPAAWSLTPTAISVCVSANWITNILVTGSFPSLIGILSMNWIFLIFGISCSILLIFLSQFLPETKNRISNFI